MGCHFRAVGTPLCEEDDVDEFVLVEDLIDVLGGDFDDPVGVEGVDLVLGGDGEG